MKRIAAKHGTTTRYYTYKCRCTKCRKAAREYMRTLRAQLKAAPGSEIPHGASGYENYGCRCEICIRGKKRSRRKQYLAAKRTAAA